MSDPKIKYDIEAAVKGEQSVEALASKLRELGDVLEGDLQQSARAAAGELDALGAKQRAVENFSALKRETHDLSEALTQAAAVVDRLGPELAEAAAKTQGLSTAERASAAALAEAMASLQRKRDALEELNAETTGAARKEEAFRATQSGLKAAIAEATSEVGARRNALRAAQQEARAAMLDYRGYGKSSGHIHSEADLHGAVLIVHGARDEVIAAAHGRSLQALVPQARLVIVPAAGHGDVQDFPQFHDAVAAALRAL